MLSRGAMAFFSVVFACGATLALVSLRGEPVHRHVTSVAMSNERRVSAPQLAQWIVEGRRDFAVVDLRTSEQYEKGHVRGAIHCGTCHRDTLEAQQMQQGESFVDLSKKLVLYADTDHEEVDLPRMVADNPRLYVLEGGWQEWKARILAPVHFGGELDESQLFAKRKQEALRGFFAGEVTQTSTRARLPVTPIRRENAHKTAAPKEGC